MNWKITRFALAAICLSAVATLAARAADEKAPKDAAADKDGFESLFDGKDLDGWKVGQNKDTFKVKDGEILVNGPGPAHLFYDGPVHNHNWKNFHFKAEVMTKPHANSGVYFHTEFQDQGWPNKGFEAQVNQTHGDPKKTGGLYNVKDVMNVSPAKDDVWYLYEVMVEGNKVTIKVDGKVTTEWEQPADWKGAPGMPGRVLSGGTFALQGHDPGSEAHFKNIMVKALPD